MHRRAQLATALLLVVVVAGCSNGSAGDTVGAEAPPAQQRGELDDTEPPSGALPADALPSTPSVPDAIPAATHDPTDAMTCDGGAVLCVDASAVGDSPDGTADLPFRTVSEALDGAGDGVTVQIAAGTYPEALVLSSRHDVALVGGFTAGGRFAEPDPAVHETVLVGNGAEATLVGELYHANRCALDGGQGAFIDSGRDTPTTAVLVHVTIAAHDCPAPALGGNAVLVTQSDTASPAPVVSVADSILWGNAGFDVFSVGSMLTVTTSLTEQVVRGDGDRTGDPSFADPVAGDFTLAAGSPATGLGHTGDLAG